MRRAFALLFVCAGLGVTFGPTRAQEPAQEPAPVVAEVPVISAGALALMETMQGGGDVPEDSTPLSALRSLMAVVSPVYPDLGGSFEGINIDQNAANTGFFQIPPDPAGAAGPNHVVAVVNSSIRWFHKDGTLDRNLTLRAFFGNLPMTTTFNPKVIYDPHRGRFVVVTLERVAPPNNRSRIYVAVSDDNDPNGTWRILEINSRLGTTPSDLWVDFPGLGLDEEAVYITGNMFTFADNAFAGVRLWIIPKGPVYGDGGSVSVRVFNPVGSGLPVTTTQPAIMYPGAPAAVGTYLMQYGGINDGTTVFLGMIRVDNPLAPSPLTPTFVYSLITIGAAAGRDTLATFPAAPQLGTTRTIATGDRRISQSPVWRNNNLYLAASMLRPVGPNASRVTARWFKINTSGVNPVLADTGIVDGAVIAAETRTFFPAVSVDRKGNMAIGFAASGPYIYPGAYYAMRLADDPPATTRGTGVLRAGLDYFELGSAPSRWGNYTGIAIDPVDEATFWVFNQYASTRRLGAAGNDGRWATAFGRFAFACTLDCPEDISAPNDPGRNGAVVTFPNPACTGSCGNLSVDIPSGTFFPVGTTVVTFTATRQDDSTDTCSFSVTVIDVEPPVISDVSVTPDTLWPPNHKMADVTVGYTVTDNVGATCSLSVSSDEPVHGLGDGDTAPDWVVVDDKHVQLRSERAGNGDGRINSVEISCTDGTWTTTETVRVTVPKSQK